MPRLYSFTIGRRNRDAAVQSVRVAATRQPQTALEQSEKAYLYSLVVSSAGYREGQPPPKQLWLQHFFSVGLFLLPLLAQAGQ